MPEDPTSKSNDIPSIPDRLLHKAAKDQADADVVYDLLGKKIARLKEEYDIIMTMPEPDRKRLEEIASELRERIEQQEGLEDAAERLAERVEDLLKFRDGQDQEKPR